MANGMTMRLEIKNKAELKTAFDRAPKLMQKEMEVAMNRSVITVQNESMKVTPVLTGRLRASHVFKVSGIGMKTIGEVWPTAEYGLFVHEGLGSNRFKGRRPFLETGLNDSIKDVDDNFTKAVQNVFDEIGRLV